MLTNGVALNKKRKLQYDHENLALSLSKHKFRDRFRSTDHTIVEEMEEMQSFNKETVLRDLRDESEEPGEESYNDSNSISEGYDTTMTSDLDDEAEKLSGKTGSSIKQQEGQEAQQRDDS